MDGWMAVLNINGRIERYRPYLDSCSGTIACRSDESGIRTKDVDGTLTGRRRDVDQALIEAWSLIIEVWSLIIEVCA